jgi:outer membrane protein OmpA-like peptidoglycan-associated protein
MSGDGPRMRQQDPGRTDDAEPARSKAPPPVPLSGPDAVLALQRTAGNAAVTRLLEDQEQSWGNPSRAAGGAPALVGTIYFRTKEWTTDGQDDAVLTQLARAYAPWAMRNAVNSGGERGLHGRVIGYADPRPSIEPDNQTLSAQRADAVARQLTRHLVQATHGLIEGDFDLQKEAGGVAPADAELTAGPENLTPLGRLRRVEIYLAGEAADPEPAQAKDLPLPDLKPVQHDDGWERWIPYIEQGDNRITQGVAGQMYMYLTNMGGKIPLPGIKSGPSTFKTGTLTYGHHGGTLPFKPVKPPGWDDRQSEYPMPALGRQALDPGAVRRRRVVEKSLMMVSDMRRLNELADRTYGNDSTAYLQFLVELGKDEPDVAKLREYAVTIQQFMFVFDAVKEESKDVLVLTGD